MYVGYVYMYCNIRNINQWFLLDFTDVHLLITGGLAVCGSSSLRIV